MDRLFFTILNMSISASVSILAVIMVRLLLRRAPKIFSYLLWAVVLIRLVCPVLPEADFGFMPNMKLAQSELWQASGRSETTHEYYASDENGQDGLEGKAHGGYAKGGDANADAKVMDAEGPGEDHSEAEFVYLPSEQINERTYPDVKLKKVLNVIPWIWGVVFGGLVVYSGVGYILFVRKIKRKEVTAPCVEGFWHPVVYLPEGLDEMQGQLVLEHEQMHIRRRDYLVKPFAFLVCCMHWFNPLAWVFFFLMERDMESSCDEAVVQKIGYDKRKDYANTLLNLSQEKGWRAGYPIAFGENHVKSRIKGVVKMKKTGLGVSIVAAVLLVAAAAFLLINRSEAQAQELKPEPETVVYLPDEKVVDVQEAEPASYQPDEKEAEVSYEKFIIPIPDIKEQIYLPGEEVPEDDGGYLPSSEAGNQESIMNYDPNRVRDQFEVLNLPQVEPLSGEEILFSYPVEGARISDTFGGRIHPVSGKLLIHLGIDFAAEAGTPITAAADGTVVKAGFDADCGNYLILLHANGTATYYFHCQEVLAEEGQKAGRGEQIATVGNTGKSTGAHLHFAASRDGAYVEPEFE